MNADVTDKWSVGQCIWSGWMYCRLQVHSMVSNESRVYVSVSFLWHSTGSRKTIIIQCKMWTFTFKSKHVDLCEYSAHVFLPRNLRSGFIPKLARNDLNCIDNYCEFRLEHELFVRSEFSIHPRNSMEKKYWYALAAAQLQSQEICKGTKADCFTTERTIVFHYGGLVPPPFRGQKTNNNNWSNQTLVPKQECVSSFVRTAGQQIAATGLLHVSWAFHSIILAYSTYPNSCLVSEFVLKVIHKYCFVRCALFR